MHPDQGPAGKAALQAQGEFGEGDGQHEIGLAAVNLACGLREPAPQARQERQRLGHAAGRQLLHREQALQATARHARPAHAVERQLARRLLAKCLHQPRADRIAPAHRSTEKIRPGTCSLPQQPAAARGRRDVSMAWTDHRLDAVAELRAAPEQGRLTGTGDSGRQDRPRRRPTPESATRSSAMQACSCVMADP